jgi:hypothetical protein
VDCTLEQPTSGSGIPGFWEGQGSYTSTVKERPNAGAAWQTSTGNVQASWTNSLNANSFQFDFSGSAQQAGALDYASYQANAANINFSLLFTLNEDSNLQFSSLPGNAGSLALEKNSSEVFSRGLDGNNGVIPSLLTAGNYELFFTLNVDDLTPSGAGHFNLTLTPASAVPIPAAAWLFGSALMGLIGRRSIKKQPSQ